MANNQLLASDNFASGNLNNWTAFFGAAKCQVVGGVSEPATLGVRGAQYYSASTLPADHISEVTTNLTSEANTTVDLWCRVQSGTYSGYVVSMSLTQANLYRCDSGSFTLLQGPITVPAPSNGDVWSISVAGAVITVHMNNTAVAHYMDATYTGGAPGYSQFSSTNLAHSKVLLWRGYSQVQQDGIWQKQGVLSGLAPLSGDMSAGAGGVANATMLYEGNAQILSGTVYKMWFCAGHPGAETNTYYAESSDGISWTRYGSAVISSFHSPYLIKVGSTYHVYVQPAASPGSGNIAHYTSSDGITWSQQSANVFSLGTSGQWDDTILWYFQPVDIIGGTWYAVYSGGHNATSYQLSLGLATSPDGVTWTRSASNPVLQGVTGGSVVNACFAKVGSTYWAWMFGNQPGFGGNVPNLNPGEGVRYSTTDFINWVGPVHSVHRSQEYEGYNFDYGQTFPNAIFTVGTESYMYVQAAASDNTAPEQYQLSLAIAPASVSNVVQVNEDSNLQTASDGFTSGIGDLSANWSTPTGFTKLQIVSGNLVEATATNTSCGMRYISSGGDNQFSQITVNALSNAGATSIIELLVRTTSNSNSYTAQLTGYGQALISKYLGGTSTQLGPTQLVTVSANDVFMFAVSTASNGNPILSLFQNGFTVLQVEDFSNAIPSGGTPGILIYTGTLASTQLKSWSGGVTGSMPFGVISGNAGVAGTIVSYSGATSGSVTADGSGNYTLPNLANGTYTVTPTLAGYVFSPMSSSETITNGNISGVNFVGTPSGTLSISGFVLGTIPYKSGVVIPPVPANVVKWTPTPSHFGGLVTLPKTFGNPVQWVSSPSHFGNKVPGGAVTVTLSGTASGSTTTDEAGGYAFTALSAGTYTVTPTKVGYAFAPISWTFTITDSVNGISFGSV